MGKLLDGFAGTTDSDGDSRLKCATWIADESKLPCSRSNHVTKSSQEKVVPIDKERTCLENTSHCQSRSIEVSTRSVVGGGKTLTAASEANANRDNVVQIDEERHCHKGVSNDLAGSTENVMSESPAAHIRSYRSSLEDKFCSLERELRDIRHLLEVTKLKVPNSTT